MRLVQIWKEQVDLELTILKDILSQSTPLIPQLQKTWNTAYKVGFHALHFHRIT